MVSTTPRRKMFVLTKKRSTLQSWYTNNYCLTLLTIIIGTSKTYFFTSARQKCSKLNVFPRSITSKQKPKTSVTIEKFSNPLLIQYSRKTCGKHTDAQHRHFPSRWFENPLNGTSGTGVCWREQDTNFSTLKWGACVTRRTTCPVA